MLYFGFIWVAELLVSFIPQAATRQEGLRWQCAQGAKLNYELCMLLFLKRSQHPCETEMLITKGTCQGSPLSWLCCHSSVCDMDWDLFILRSHSCVCNYYHVNYVSLWVCFRLGELPTCWYNLMLIYVFLIAQLEASFEEMESHLLCLEDLCEQCELERYKCMQTLQLENYKKTKR